MSVRQIHVFISHSWSYSNHYDTLAGWIFGNRWSVGSASLDFRNYSVPKDDPIHNAPTDAALRQAIFRQIAGSHVVIIPTGMYANYSNWIQKEIDGANNYKKKILGVDPWGQKRSSSLVVDASHTVVGWNKQSVIDGIWSLYKE